MQKSLDVAILIFNGVEELDFAGPFEVFSVASRVARRDRGDAIAPFAPFLLAATDRPVQTRHGMTILPKQTLPNVRNPDIVIVPGGVMSEPMRDADLIAWLIETHASTRVTASVCTGAFLLAKAGLLDSLSATTHWEDLDELRRLAPAASVREGVRYIDQGRIVTSAGIAAGIEMSLALVARFQGEALSISTARQMEYPFDKEAGIPT